MSKEAAESKLSNLVIFQPKVSSPIAMIELKIKVIATFGSEGNFDCSSKKRIAVIRDKLSVDKEKN